MRDVIMIFETFFEQSKCISAKFNRFYRFHARLRVFIDERGEFKKQMENLLLPDTPFVNTTAHQHP